MDYRKEYERWMKQAAMDEDIVEELNCWKNVVFSMTCRLLFVLLNLYLMRTAGV